MRLRFGVFLCLLAVWWGVGCRKPLTPNIDRNVAPETWITAAPMDTITAKDEKGRRIPGDPSVQVIPVRFHMYWAGSDPDGAVVGFYYAVTETTATLDPLTGVVPSLPGPKPRDYRYTTKTDTTFVFNVTEGAPDRQHGFFLYAVDNLGKADATPARFTFTAIDEFPPTPIFDLAQGIGTVYTYEGGSYANGRLVGGRLVENRDVRDFTDQNLAGTVARDSAAINARLRFKWHAALGIAGTFVSKYCYRLEETQFGCVPAQMDSVNYPGGGFAAGTKVFTVRIVDQAGGARDSTRRFVMNYMPDTWFSGPDPADPQFVQSREPATGDRRYIDLAGVDMSTWAGVTGTLMHRDSLKVLPLLRQPRKTFFEIYDKRLYAHVEGDTVHMNSWVVLFNGGYDKDSRYRVLADTLDPALPQPPKDQVNYPVIFPGPENGSPIGFRSLIVMKTDPKGQLSSFVQTSTYPNFQPTAVFRATRVGGYWPMFFSGKAYALARAEDGDGQLDAKVEEPRSLADRVDGNGGTPEEGELRRREIMTYYVNKPPFFLTTIQGFSPKSDGSTLFTGPLWNINLPAADVDPYDPRESSRPVGVPTPQVILRYKLTVLGSSFYTGLDTTWVYDPGTPESPYYFNSPTPPGATYITIPPNLLRSGPVKVSVELCDCTECEKVSGQGRCITREFVATYSRTDPAAPNTSLSPDRGGTR